MTDIVNGVDRDALFDTIDAVKEDGELAKFGFRIENEWIDGGYNVSTVNGFSGTKQEHARETPFEIYNDEPPVLLSGDKGPNPVENLLHALAGCMTTSMVYHAAAKNIPVKGVRTRFEGDLDLKGFLGLDPKVRKGYQAIRVVFDIEGDLTTDEKRELMALAPQFSPVFDVVRNGTAIDCVLAEDRAGRAAA